jgi:uncharacterized phage-associated protein
MPPVRADDVVAYILKRQGSMTAMKLQKLLYYSQAWSLVWDEEPLFKEPIEAWANGPVVPSVFRKHKGRFRIDSWPNGNPRALNKIQRETVNAVLSYYGDKNSQWLSDLTHREEPWQAARQGLSAGDRGQREITLSSMMEYYSSL